MSNKKQRMQTYIDQFLLDERLRKRTLLIVVSMILLVLSLSMTALNLLSGKDFVALLTGSFSVVLIIVLTLFIFFRLERPGTLILMISLYSLFTVLLIQGGADGFSPVWLLLLPTYVFSLFGIRRGAYFSSILLAIIIMVLWTPLFTNIRFDYNEAFTIRFPIAYMTSMFIGAVIELERYMTHKKLSESQGRLHYLSHIDELTKLQNRRAFNVKLSEYWEDALETGSPISAMMIDIDCFKLYNDHYGHMAGDAVLIETAQCISDILPDSTDVVARWGGEEFVVLLPNTDSDEAVGLAEKIRMNLEGRDLPHEMAKLREKRVTASIGVATIIPDGEVSSKNLLEKADRSLYHSKSQGGNRTSQL